MKTGRTIIPVLFVLAFTLSGPALASHNDITRIRCLSCHVKLPFNKIADRFSTQSIGVCQDCHREERITFSHPVGIPVRMKFPKDLPLSEDGKLICITCHTFHKSNYLPGYRKKTYLRRRVLGKRFCLICHEKDPLVPVTEAE